MEKSEFGDLLTLCAKASLFKTPHHGLERLENLLRCLNDLQKFSPDEKEQLLDQFKNQPVKVRDSLTKSVANPTRLLNFHLSVDDVQRLAVARWGLAFHERAAMAVIRGGGLGGSAWLDLGNLFQVEIEIDDHSSPDREKRPYAHLCFTDGERCRAETVDILGSVSQNPCAIGHPAIVAAVQHWQELMYSKNIHRRLNRGDDDPDTASIRDFFSKRHVEIAENNLKALCDALVHGAGKGSVGPQRSLVHLLEELDLDNKGKLLFHVWSWLKKTYDSCFEGENRLQEFKSSMRTLLDATRIQISEIDQKVIQRFFDDRDGAGGYKFLLATKRPPWATFRNAFAAWYFGVSVGSIKTYRSESSRDSIDSKKVVDVVVGPERMSFLPLLRSVLQTPLVFARDAVELGEDEIVRCIEDAISERGSVN